jgi:hypothetical protein
MTRCSDSIGLTIKRLLWYWMLKNFAQRQAWWKGIAFVRRFLTCVYLSLYKADCLKRNRHLSRKDLSTIQCIGSVIHSRVNITFRCFRLRRSEAEPAGNCRWFAWDWRSGGARFQNATTKNVPITFLETSALCKRKVGSGIDLRKIPHLIFSISVNLSSSRIAWFCDQICRSWSRVKGVSPIGYGSLIFWEEQASKSCTRPNTDRIVSPEQTFSEFKTISEKYRDIWKTWNSTSFWKFWNEEISRRYTQTRRTH